MQVGSAAAALCCLPGSVGTADTAQFTAGTESQTVLQISGEQSSKGDDHTSWVLYL